MKGFMLNIPTINNSCTSHSKFGSIVVDKLLHDDRITDGAIAPLLLYGFIFLQCFYSTMLESFAVDMQIVFVDLVWDIHLAFE